ncbi:acyltransferase [Halieaceae bacterium IMCC14734]|uniref:Acyltransferase n=1 Tax=Candidatus Litorirhabdus singularis TaxID=2518993 RepID=A0ABT3TEA7_9GAMM|nr:acyltransferase family protein [Candidatus Litorirhabdus singularis]MCX2980650.1 acyltransferase [Candidatus Litorirhabdus singularis]
MKYRSDIDGLRAVAVLPVVLYHAGYTWIPGGFVGVDIFFVISGYLISSIIAKEIQQERFTFLSFYLRRVRRIIPALLVVLTTTVIAGYYFLLPTEYVNLAQATIATLAFVPNIFFFDASTTYFGLDVATEPLLHTWSLGVELQFYILFPLLMIPLSRYLGRVSLGCSIVLLLALSLALNLALTPYLSKFAFYLLPTRAWELLFGVVLGLGLIPVIRSYWLANVVAMCGLLLIAGTMLLLSASDPFPGINAVYPVLGAALIIWANTGNNTLIAKLLSVRLMVLVGLISYSLYLWHWPVMVFVLMLEGGPITKALIVAVSLLLATLSYRYVEGRYRKTDQPLNDRQLGKELGFLTVIILLGVAVIIGSNGLASRVPESAFSIVDELENYHNNTPASCEDFGRADGDRVAQACQLGDENGAPEFVLWGDSHAEALMPGLQRAALKTGNSGIAFHYGGCRPLLGVSRENDYRCLNFGHEVMAFIESNPSIRQVYLAGYWRLPLLSFSYDNSNFFIVDEESGSSSPGENRQVFSRGLARTLHALKDKDIFFVEDIPEVGASFGKSVSSNFIRQAWLSSSQTDTLRHHKRQDLYKVYLEAALTNQQQSFEVIPTQATLCEGNQCPLTIDGSLVYNDGDHISLYGAYLLSPLFEETLGRLLRDKD